ncbi:hypothetical protein [Pseudomonas sp. Marseille-QA0892]
MSTPKYLIKGNLSEPQIEADVASYFSWCTPLGSPGPLRLVDVNEQITGADKRFDAGCTIYMQFKKSTGLHSSATVPISSSKGRSRMEDIREFRHLNNLEEDPTLFFPLRKKAEKAHHLQHNVLLSHEVKGFSKAFYVAPLELDKSKYYQTLFNEEFRFHGDPIWFRRHTAIRERFLVRYLSCSPYLREHVAITPHERVQDHQHFYSYSQTGTDICWHSPLLVGRGPSRLSDVISDVVRKAIETGGESLASLESLSETTWKISREIGLDIKVSNNSLETIKEHGRLVAENYRIRQFVFLANKDQLRQLSEKF